METKPLVSIVVPAYNCSNTIKTTIESVIEQTYRNWELIVIDDCSFDDTYSVLQSISKTEERIVLNKNDFNLGVAETRNKGIDIACGEYIAFLDSDDIWLPQKLEKQMEVMVENSAVLSCTSYSFIDKDDIELPNKVSVPEQINLSLLVKKNIIGCSTVVVKKDIMEKYKMSNEYYSEDYVAWLQILKECKVAYGLTSAYTKYRFMNGTKSSNKIKSGLKLYSVYRKLLKMSRSQSLYRLIAYFFYGVSKYNRLLFKN